MKVAGVISIVPLLKKDCVNGMVTAIPRGGIVMLIQEDADQMVMQHKNISIGKSRINHFSISMKIEFDIKNLFIKLSYSRHNTDINI